MNKLTIKLTPQWGLFQQMETVSSLQVDEWLSFSEDKTWPNHPLNESNPVFCFPDMAFGGRCPFPDWEYLCADDALGEIS